MFKLLIDHTKIKYPGFRVLRFSRYTISKYKSGLLVKNNYWLCKCKCGIKFEKRASEIKETTSCPSCSLRLRGLNRVFLKIDVPEHVVSLRRIKRIWNAMVRRCYSPGSDSYKNYGLRGIGICQEWLLTPSEFVEWSFLNGYRNDLSIDRKDNSKGYGPKNCKWSTRIEQHNNKRNNRYYEIKGNYYTLAEIGRAFDIPYDLLYSRVRLQGKDVYSAVAMGKSDKGRKTV